MHTIRSQLTHIRCTETTSHIQTHVEVVVDVTDGTDTSCKAVEVAGEVSKAHVTIFLKSVTV